MAKHILTVRLSAPQYRILEKLEQKLSIDKTNLIRLAITRLAESEGFFAADQPEHNRRKLPPTSFGKPEVG